LINERYKEFSGIDESGRSVRLSSLDSKDCSLDLLNVRYLLALAEDQSWQKERDSEVVADFEENSPLREINRAVETDLRSGQKVVFSMGRGADNLALISMLSNSGGVADNQEVATMTIGCGSSTPTVLPVRAGRDTSEWAYDRADVRATVKHARAPVAKSWSLSSETGNFEGHSYLSRLKLPDDIGRCQTDLSLQVTNTSSANVVLNLKNLVPYNSLSKHLVPIKRDRRSGLNDRSRWRQLPQQSTVRGETLVTYENLHAMPRAWLVGHLESKPEIDQLKLIHGGSIDTHFDPRSMAMIEPDLADRVDRRLLAATSEASVGSTRIVSRHAGALVIEANVARNAMLVLSEIAMPGWRVEVDGKETNWWRVNYILCGVALESGNHLIKFFWRPHAFVIGAWMSAIAFLCIILALLWYYLRKKNRNQT